LTEKAVRGTPPHPKDLENKAFIFMELCRIALRKIVSTTDLAAEFSKQRGYGMLFFAKGREQANSRFFLNSDCAPVAGYFLQSSCFSSTATGEPL
jgi:hypothetical protein